MLNILGEFVSKNFNSIVRHIVLRNNNFRANLYDNILLVCKWYFMNEFRLSNGIDFYIY